MQFTHQELKLVERLRKQERQWPRQRWWMLAAALISAVNLVLWGGLLFTTVLAGFDDSRTSREELAIYVAVLFPKCLMWAGITAWLFAKLFTEWHGNVNRMLLLKLLDAQQKDSVKSDPPC